MALTVDTRTASEYGVVRTFGQADFQFSTQGSNNVNPNTFTASPGAGTNTSLINGPGEGYVAVQYVFIQFAGFTFGKSASAYATPWQGFPGTIRRCSAVRTPIPVSIKFSIPRSSATV